MPSPDLVCLTPEHSPLPDGQPLGASSVLCSRLDIDAFKLEHGGNTYFFSPTTRSFASVSARLLDLVGRCDGSRDAGTVLHEAGHTQDSLRVLATLARSAVLWSEAFGTIRPRAAVEPEPVFTVMPTTACQLRCVYCYSDSEDPKSGRFLDPRAFPAALDGFLAEIFRFAPRARLAFHGGGEPTLDFRLMRDLVRVFRERCEACWISPSFLLTTNGAFGADTCSFLIDNGFDCRVSLDGTAAVQNSQRPLRNGGASFGRAIANIRKLVAAGCKVGIRPTVTASSVGRMVETVELAAAEGIASVHFARLIDSDRARASGIYAPDPEAFAEGFSNAFRRALELGIGVQGEGSYCLAGRKHRYCGACGLNWILSASAHVSMCTEIQGPSDPDAEQFLIGRVDPGSGTLETFPGVRERLSRRSVENLPGCAACWLKYSCAGECPLQARRRAGDMMKTGSPACDLIRRMNADVVAQLVHSNAPGIPAGLGRAVAYERVRLDL